ncbi:TPA: enoyl-CoA hydratase/isomerase family protein [Candidatus Woesearchaeota archaeon]|nr:enoyl-CoA hydratase/isomerase family protein [Candidatus Woesearchaeota archaeon]HII69445.1 enoyl-CoA hydratase/isomerase family protein [Candidatus Woesearchaeota archaeon]
MTTVHHDNVLFASDRAVGTITLNRPQKLNALSYCMAQELLRILAKAKKSRLKAIVVRGAGTSFCAGGDVAWEQSLATMPRKEATAQMLQFKRIVSEIEQIPQVVIAVIHGHAVGGGCELAMACDIRVALLSAQFRFPEVALGVVPPLGASARLSRLIGPGRAKYLLFSGEALDCATALSWGLVDFRFSAKKAEAFVSSFCSKVSGYSPKALALAKKLVNKGMLSDLQDKTELDAYFSCCGDEYNATALENFLRKI